MKSPFLIVTILTFFNENVYLKVKLKTASNEKPELDSPGLISYIFL